MHTDKKKLLLFVDWFFPGYKAGGPIQSCRNIVDILKDDFDIYIFTSDRDIGDLVPYSNIIVNQWTDFDIHTKIFYSNSLFCTVKNMQNLIGEIKPHTIYLNSMFSFLFTLKPLLALKKLKNDIKIVLAPRGMLHAGAIKIKKVKKIFFLNFLKNTGLIRNVIFHATDEQEINDIKKYFSTVKNVKLVENIPHINTTKINFCKKDKGAINFVFVSRIHPKKNILYFIDILSGIKEHAISLDIYGYIDNEPYKQKCYTAIKKLPENISIQFKGSIPNYSVFETISQYHVFVLPTLGENFGHAIFEALSAGRPVLISDQTPWRNLASQKTGWDIPLNQPKEFTKAIAQIANWAQHEFDDWCNNAYNFAHNFIDHQAIKQQYLSLFS